MGEGSGVDESDGDSLGANASGDAVSSLAIEIERASSEGELDALSSEGDSTGDGVLSSGANEALSVTLGEGEGEDVGVGLPLADADALALALALALADGYPLVLGDTDTDADTLGDGDAMTTSLGAISLGAIAMHGAGIPSGS